MTRTVPTNHGANHEANVQRMVTMMTAAAWATLTIGLLLSLFNLYDFSDRNTALMVGVGFMVGSVHIYVIRTAIHLVHRWQQQLDSKDNS